jgi:hypothetical protein
MKNITSISFSSVMPAGSKPSTSSLVNGNIRGISRICTNFCGMTPFRIWGKKTEIKIIKRHHNNYYCTE